MRVEQEIRAVRLALSYLIDAVQHSPSRKSSDELSPSRMVADHTTLIIIDEADRLKTATLEQIQDIYGSCPELGERDRSGCYRSHYPHYQWKFQITTPLTRAN